MGTVCLAEGAPADRLASRGADEDRAALRVPQVPRLCNARRDAAFTRRSAPRGGAARACRPRQARSGGHPRNRIRGAGLAARPRGARSEEHTSELQSQSNLVCRLLLEKKKKEQKSRV